MDAHGGTTTYDAAPEVATPRLPWVMWAFAWSWVVGQLLLVARYGVRDDGAGAVSALLGVAVVTFFAHGVLRARPVRFWVVAALLPVGAIAQLLLLPRGGWIVLGLGFTLVQLGLLVVYRRSPWFAWQRTRPATGPSLVPVLLLAVVVGALAGVVDRDEPAPIDMRVRTGF